MSTPIVGYTFPFRLVNGKVPLDNGVDVIKASILTILSWPMFHRYYLFLFGSRLYECEEEPNDGVLANLIRTFIIETISTWEKRVELDPSKIHITQTMTTIDIVLYYRIKGLGVEDFVNLTYKNINSI